jgi:general L-amino acid transport system permease protein
METLPTSIRYVRSEESPTMAPPVSTGGVGGWLKENLFASPRDTVLTIVTALFLLWIVPPIIDWAFISAVWTGDSREACLGPGTGACWAFVEAKFGQFIYGRYPIEEWGGLLVTLVVAVTGIVVSLPLGILLALGRRSKMPVVKMFCVIFIEFWRGVPLITVLFMSSVMLPLFLPEGVTFDKLLRALIGVALFSSAYMAEVVRGGLQAIPKGQYEAPRRSG